MVYLSRFSKLRRIFTSVLGFKTEEFDFVNFETGIRRRLKYFSACQPYKMSKDNRMKGMKQGARRFIEREGQASMIHCQIKLR